MKKKQKKITEHALNKKFMAYIEASIDFGPIEAVRAVVFLSGMLATASDVPQDVVIKAVKDGYKHAKNCACLKN